MNFWGIIINLALEYRKISLIHYLYPSSCMISITHLNILPLLLPHGSEWIIILIVILLLFGGKKIPELMRGLGKGVSSFKQGVQDAKDEIRKASEEEPAAKNDSDATPKSKDRD